MMEFTEFMIAMVNSPVKSDCPNCRGIGYRPIYCCSGFQCGCMGMVCDFKVCDCGAREPTEEELREWLEESKKIKGEGEG